MWICDDGNLKNLHDTETIHACVHGEEHQVEAINPFMRKICKLLPEEDGYSLIILLHVTL